MGVDPERRTQARASWVKVITANLDTIKFAEVEKDAPNLVYLAYSVGEKNPNPVAKELTVKLSTQANVLADTAGRNDGADAKSKLAEVNATCGDCHAEIRDKKIRFF